MPGQAIPYLSLGDACHSPVQVLGLHWLKAKTEQSSASSWSFTFSSGSG